MSTQIKILTTVENLISKAEEIDSLDIDQIDTETLIFSEQISVLALGFLEGQGLLTYEETGIHSGDTVRRFISQISLDSKLIILYFNNELNKIFEEKGGFK